MQEDPKDILELNYLENKKLLKHINYDNYMKIVSNIIEKQPIKVYVSYDATVRCLLKLIELQPVKTIVKLTKLNSNTNGIILIYDTDTKKLYKVKNINKFNELFKKEILFTKKYDSNRLYFDAKKLPTEVKIMIFLEDLFNTSNNDKLENLYDSFKKILDNPIEEKNISLKMEFRNYMELLYFKLKDSIYIIHSIGNFDLRCDMSYYFNGGFSFAKESIEAFIEWLSSANKYVSISNYPNIKFEKKFDNHCGRNFAYNISNFIKLLNALFLTKNSFDNLQYKYDHDKISTEEFVNAYKNYLDAIDLLNLFKEVIDNLVYNYYVEFNTPNGIIVLQNKPKIQE